MARAAACFNPNSDVESSIEDCDQPSVRLQNVVANKKDEPLNDNKNNPCYVLVENEVIQNTTSLELWQEITDSGNYGLEYTLTHNTPDLHQSKDQVLTDNVTQSVPIASQYVSQKQFAEHVLKEGTNTFTDFGFDESMSEPPTPLPTRRPRFDSELSCSVSTMSEISTSSSQLQNQNRPGSHVHIYNMHIAKADLRTVHTEKAEITNVNIDKAENVSSSNDSNKTNSRNTDAGLKIIDDAEWHIRFHEENGIRLNNTQVFHEAVKKLGWNKVIVIVGNSGCGKRSLSMELLRHFSNDETEFGCTPVIIKDSCDWNTHVNPKCEYIILLDSLCGSAGIFNREHFLKWDPYFKDILKYIKNSKEFNEPFFVIMTMRDKIWKENKIFFREYDLFRELENYIFDMTNEYGFSCKEKYMMLSNILSKSYKQKLTRVQICSEYRQEYLEESNSHDLKISERTLKHISRISTPVGFLRCIVEFVGNERHTRKGSVFFERPLDLLVNELNFLLHLEENKENRYHYFLLILIVWHDGCFYLDRPLQCEEDILSLINEDNETKILNFFNNFTISKRNGIYFKFSEEMNCCELTHEALSDAVCLSLGKRCIAFVLKNAVTIFYQNIFMSMPKMITIVFRLFKRIIAVCLRGLLKNFWERNLKLCQHMKL